jgi:pantothenate kinase
MRDYETEKPDYRQAMHDLMNELANINQLCQLIKRTQENEKIDQYVSLMSELSDDTIRLCRRLIDSPSEQ